MATLQEMQSALDVMLRDFKPLAVDFNKIARAWIHAEKEADDAFTRVAEGIVQQVDTLGNSPRQIMAALANLQAWIEFDDKAGEARVQMQSTVREYMTRRRQIQTLIGQLSARLSYEILQTNDEEADLDLLPPGLRA